MLRVRESSWLRIWRRFWVITVGYFLEPRVLLDFCPHAADSGIETRAVGDLGV